MTCQIAALIVITVKVEEQLLSTYKHTAYNGGESVSNSALQTVISPAMLLAAVGNWAESPP